MRLNLTKAAVERLPIPPSDREYHADTKMPGLRVCVWASGKRVFYLYRKIAGRPERIKLGVFPDLSVEAARAKAQSLAGKIAQGENPAFSRRQLAAEATFGELFDWYLEHHAKAHKRSWRDDESKFRLHLFNLARRKISSLTRRDFAGIHSAITKKGQAATANRVLALASSVFGTAIRAEKWSGINPCAGIQQNKEVSRDRFLRGDELRKFLESVNAEANETIRDYVLVSVLTGARRGNVVAMRWDQIDLDAAEWRIPAEHSKNGTVLTLPLAPPVVQILRQRRADENGEWVFAASRADSKCGYLRGTQRAWQRILDRAGIADLRLHDLRHTFASWQVRTGASLHLIGKTLGHLDAKSTAIYANVDLDPMRASVERATAAMLAEGATRPSLNVAPIRIAKRP